MIGRRTILASAGGALATAAQAQTGQPPRRVGVLMAIPTDDHTGLAVLREGLVRLGWLEGRNLAMDIRSTRARPELAASLAQQLVAQRPEVLVGHTLACAMALKAATATVPIIGVAIADPVGFGLVTNLPRPEANVTAFANFEPSISGKWLELLSEVTPGLKRVGFMFNPATSTVGEYLRALRSAAPRYGVAIVEAPVHDVASIENTVSILADGTPSGLIVPPDVFLTSNRESVVDAVERHRLPTVYGYRAWVDRGGLMVYGVDTDDLFRRAATYVDRVLKGARAADLPVQFPAKLEFVINLKAARAAGLTVPTSLLVRAGEVIE